MAMRTRAISDASIAQARRLQSRPAPAAAPRRKTQRSSKTALSPGALRLRSGQAPRGMTRQTTLSPLARLPDCQDALQHQRVAAAAARADGVRQADGVELQAQGAHVGPHQLRRAPTPREAPA